MVDIDLGNFLPAVDSNAGNDADDANPGVSFEFQATAIEIEQLKDLIGKSAIDVCARDNGLAFSDGQQNVLFWKPTRPVPPNALFCVSPFILTEGMRAPWPISYGPPSARPKTAGDKGDHMLDDEQKAAAADGQPVVEKDAAPPIAEPTPRYHS